MEYCEPENILIKADNSVFCLICGSTHQAILENKNNYFTQLFDNHSHSSGISQQLNVIFILKHLLQVPTCSLQSYLVKLGNLSDWQISLCEECTQLVNQAKDLHFQILGISAKLKRIQKEIVDKAKRLQDNHDDIDIFNGNLVYKETRQFVQNYNYDDHLLQSDPILEGNQLIKKLLEEATTKVKNEEDDPFYDNLGDTHTRIEVKMRYFCTFCGKGFLNKRHMDRHETLHRNKESKPFLCEIWGRGFATVGYVHDHKKYKHWGTLKKKTKKKAGKKGEVKGEEGGT